MTDPCIKDGGGARTALRLFSIRCQMKKNHQQWIQNGRDIGYDEGSRR
ncbi:hypothetical protein [Salinicoccus roseus]